MLANLNSWQTTAVFSIDVVLLILALTASVIFAVVFIRRARR